MFCPCFVVHCLVLLGATYFRASICLHPNSFLLVNCKFDCILAFFAPSAVHGTNSYCE